MALPIQSEGERTSSSARAGSTESYTVRQLDPREAEASVLRLWRDNRSSQIEMPAIYRWYYLRGAEFAGACVLLEHQNSDGAASPVGSAGLGSRGLMVGGKHTPAGLFGDFVVDREHRSLFPAMQLQRAVRDLGRKSHALSYGFPNDKALPVFRRLGFTEVGRTRRYVKVLSLAPYLARALARFGFLATIVVLLARWWARVPQRFFGSRCSTGTWVDHFDERFNALSERADLGAQVRGSRNARFLEWRFRQMPGATTQTYATLESGSGSLLGYVVSERVGDVLHVRDLLALDVPHLRDLLLSFERAARSSGVSSVSFSLLPSPQVHSQLTAMGYKPRDPSRSVIVDCATPELLPKGASWFLTEADEDQ